MQRTLTPQRAHDPYFQPAGILVRKPQLVRAVIRSEFKGMGIMRDQTSFSCDIYTDLAMNISNIQPLVSKEGHTTCIIQEEACIWSVIWGLELLFGQF